MYAGFCRAILIVGRERKAVNMNQEKTGSLIYTLRTEKGMTQKQLADVLAISDKTVSKWERGAGCPDISLLRTLCDYFGVDMEKMLDGELAENDFTGGNMKKSKFYVCPVCGNVLHSLGAAVVSCCGVALPPLESEEPDAEHEIAVEPVEDEFYVSVRHPMTRGHHISFLAFASDERLELVKLYPEGDAAARFSLRGGGWLYAYCNRHGLMRRRV